MFLTLKDYFLRIITWIIQWSKNHNKNNEYKFIVIFRHHDFICLKHDWTCEINVLKNIFSDLSSLVQKSRSKFVNKFQLGSKFDSFWNIFILDSSFEVKLLFCLWHLQIFCLRYGTWYLYAACSFVAIIFFSFTLPETKVVIDLWTRTVTSLIDQLKMELYVDHVYLIKSFFS